LEKFPPKADAFKNALSRLENAANAIGKAWSGSWLGHHARIYYEDLQPPPPGAHFSQEWGMKQRLAIEGTTGSWREFDEETVTRSIYKAAGNPSLTAARALAETAESTFEDTKPEVLSLLSTAISERQDSFLSDLKHEVEQTVVLSQLQVIQQMEMKGGISVNPFWYDVVVLEVLFYFFVSGQQMCVSCWAMNLLDLLNIRLNCINMSSLTVLLPQSSNSVQF